MKSFKILTLAISLILSSCGNSKSDQSLPGGQEDSIAATTSLKVKTDIFNDIEKTKNLLSQNGIGELKTWRSDEMGGFMSITDYFQFGSTATGMKNSLAYYLESDNVGYIRTVELALNINNKGDKKNAITKFKETVEVTFRSLALEIPKGLSDAITKETNYQADSDTFTTNLKLDKSNIDTWKLIIETK